MGHVAWNKTDDDDDDIELLLNVDVLVVDFTFSQPVRPRARL